jgi:N-acetylmuramoyl-L-alanine amidase
MKIIDHWLDGAKRAEVFGGKAMDLRRILVMHATCGATAISSIDGWREKGDGICTHLVIDRDGTIYQCRPFNRQCFHVRDQCEWQGWRRLNRCSIGIELANACSDPSALSWAKRQPGYAGMWARHPNGGPSLEWEYYPKAQLEAAMAARNAIVERYNLDGVVPHESLDPSRRDDPGPAFPKTFWK